MKLSDLFSPIQKQNSTVNEPAKAEFSSAERFQNQIKTIAPGKTLQGEIVGKNGNEVRIKVSEDIVFTAKLEQDVNVEEGQTLTFEVRNNGKTLTLSPLFTNTAVADNVMKALRMANVPIQNATVTMTETMMQQGMSIDSKSLQAMFKELTANPGANAADIVKLKHMGIPVDENSLQQMKSYNELTHQLVRGMTDVLSEIPAAFSQVMQADGTGNAVSMYQELMQLFSEGMSAGAASANAEGGVSQQTVQNPEVVGMTPTGATVSSEVISGENSMITAATLENAIIATEEVLSGSTFVNGEGTLQQEGVSQNPETGNLVEHGFTKSGDIFTAKEGTQLANLLMRLPAEQYPQAEKLAMQLQQGNANIKELFQFLAKVPPAQNSTTEAILADIFKSDGFGKLFQNVAMKQWTIEPEKLMDKEVKEVYERLHRQLNGVSEVLNSHGAGQSTAATNVTNLAQNIDFMNQINQLYTYVQLPLKMQNGQNNGELYVYTNKRSLANKDGNISALLHLDMEHLGPVDVYVTLQNNRASTRFTVRDDEMLDFLNDHMYILNERLEKKGYSMNWELTTKGEKEPENPIERILQTEKNVSVLSQYAFDVRT